MSKQNSDKGNSGNNNGGQTGQSTSIKGRQTPTPPPPKTSGDKK